MDENVSRQRGSFDSIIARVRAAITGRRTYDIAGAWGGEGELPGAPLFVVTHHVPDNAPAAIPPYTFITDGIGTAVAQARAAAQDKDVRLMEHRSSSNACGPGCSTSSPSTWCPSCSAAASAYSTAWNPGP